jgi:uncharacterized Zn finger protein
MAYKIWVKCYRCGYSFSTVRTDILRLLQEDTYTCKECGKLMNLAHLLYCDVEKSDDECTACEYRFKCLTEIT